MCSYPGNSPAIKLFPNFLDLAVPNCVTGGDIRVGTAVSRTNLRPDFDPIGSWIDLPAGIDRAIVLALQAGGAENDLLSVLATPRRSVRGSRDKGDKG